MKMSRIGLVAGMGRPMAELTITDEDRETLTRWSRRATSSQALALRSRIVLACADGKFNQDVAAALGVWPQTVGTWRRRFIEAGPDGLCDEPGLAATANTIRLCARTRRRHRGELPRTTDTSVVTPSDTGGRQAWLSGSVVTAVVRDIRCQRR